MIEKIRISLWDIFTFFAVGFLAFCLFIYLLVSHDGFAFGPFVEYVYKSTTISVLLLPLIFTILGMLIEPFANLFDKKILDSFFTPFLSNIKTRNIDIKMLSMIKSSLLGPLNGQVDDPFWICKEYVENNELSASYMIFLSRYGFYRSIAFLSFIGLVSAIYLQDFFSVIVWLFLMLVFKWRSLLFYSYQAPAIYAAYFMHKTSGQ